MAVELSLSITKKQWFSQPALRWNAGLNQAGVNWRQHLQRAYYPPAPPNSRYVRTGATADRANYNINDEGKEMDLGSTSYTIFLLMPARTVVNWSGKKDEEKLAIEQGFRDGVANYTGA